MSSADGKHIEIGSHVDSITMPDNLSIALMVSEYRKKCNLNGCPFDYHAFAFGQSPFHVPEPLVEALAGSSDQGHYSSAVGIPELREAVAGYNKRHFGIDVDGERIIIGPGTKDLIHMIFDIIHGGAILPSPSWIGYSPQIKLLDKHFHTLHLKSEDGYKIQPDALESLMKTIEGDQHLLVINNPHNPTGAVYSRDELEAITDVCRRNNILVIADEIYALTTYNLEDFTSLGVIYPEGTFVTNGLSKDRSAGGYRLGHLILPEKCTEELRDAFRKVAATVYTNVSTPTQYASVTAYSENPRIAEYFDVTRNIHRMMGKHFSAEFDSIDGIKATIPYGGFYFFADFNELKGELKAKGVENSNGLGFSLIAHPFHFAAVTGDACLLDPDDYGARIAFVDYDGRAAYDYYLAAKPESAKEEKAFVVRNAPRMVQGVETLRKYVEHLRS